MTPLLFLLHSMRRMGLVGLCLLNPWIPFALADSPYPNRSLRLIAGMPAGGGADLNARRLAEQLHQVLKQNVIVENMGGAAGNAAAVAVMGANSDGYTLFFSSHPVFAVNPVLYEGRLPFKPEAFAPVALVSQAAHVLLASLALPAQNVNELISLARANPKRINFGSGGAGTSIHLAAELLNQITHIHLVHIPYRGSAPAAIALASNEIQLLFDNSMTAIGHVRAGRVKALAIGAKIRLPAINDVPTFIESGLPGFEVSISHGVWMLKTVSPVVLKTINQAINLSVQDKDYKNSMNEFGVSLMGGSAEQLASFIIQESKKYGELIRNQKITAD